MRQGHACPLGYCMALGNRLAPPRMVRSQAPRVTRFQSSTCPQKRIGQREQCQQISSDAADEVAGHSFLASEQLYA